MHYSRRFPVSINITNSFSVFTQTEQFHATLLKILGLTIKHQTNSIRPSPHWTTLYIPSKHPDAHHQYPGSSHQPLSYTMPNVQHGVRLHARSLGPSSYTLTLLIPQYTSLNASGCVETYSLHVGASAARTAALVPHRAPARSPQKAMLKICMSRKYKPKSFPGPPKRALRTGQVESAPGSFMLRPGGLGVLVDISAGIASRGKNQMRIPSVSMRVAKRPPYEALEAQSETEQPALGGWLGALMSPSA